MTMLSCLPAPDPCQELQSHEQPAPATSPQAHKGLLYTEEFR